MKNYPHADIEAINRTVEAVRRQPALGQVTFNLKSQSLGNLTLASETGPLTQAGQKDGARAGKFSLTSDEPVALLGTDMGVSPAEYALKALAGCYAVTLASMAASEGIELSKLALDLNFDINLNGFLGIDKNVRNGAQSIRVDITLDSPTASREQLESLVRDLPTHSPIHDTLANPVNVQAKLVSL